MARRTFIGALLGNWLGGNPVGESNPFAGAQPELGDDGEVVDYKLPDGSKADPTEVSKYGTGALKRSSSALRVFNEDAANRIDAINTQFNAQPAEAQQKYVTEIRQLEDRIHTSDPSLTSEQVSQRAAQVGTKAFSMGYGPTDAARILESQTDLREGGPQARGALSSVQAKNELELAPREKASRSALLDLSAASSASRQRLLPDEEATQKAELQERMGTATGANKRMGLKNQVLDADMLNQLAEKTGIDRQRLAVISADLDHKLGRQATEFELEDAIQNNQLFEQQNLTMPNLQAGANIAKGNLEASRMVSKALPLEAGSRLMMANQPPDTGRPTLYRANPGALESGDLVKGYSSLGWNPTFMSPMDKANAMMNRMGQNGGSGGVMQLPSGRKAIVGMRPTMTAPITNISAPPTTMPMNAAVRQPMSAPITSAIPAAPTNIQQFSDAFSQQPTMSPAERIQYLKQKQQVYTITPGEEDELQRLTGGQQ